jgi:hypothetical protein
MLILACQKGDSGLFRQLAKHYATHLKETDELWTEALANIGEIWFGIKIPKQGNNPLFDMMSNMMFGGAGMGGGGQKQATPRSGTPKPKIESGKAGAGSGTGTGTATPASNAGNAPPTMDLD